MSEYIGHCKRDIMDRIIAIRYTDLEQEKQFCLELLEWATGQQDNYAIAFAHTYLGDYYIAQNESEAAAAHLTEAEALLEQEEGSFELLVRLHNLLGIYYETQADEQSSVQYYVKALSMARRIDNKHSECTILNNLAHSLQVHKSYEKAYDYYKEAYALLSEYPDSDIWSALLGNLAELALILGKKEDAAAYLEECVQKQKKYGTEQDTIFLACNQCCYYIACGEIETALSFADEVLEKKDFFKGNKLSAFENYTQICKGLIANNNREYAELFLEQMAEVCSAQSMEQLQQLEAQRMSFCLKFESEEKRALAYCNYYHKTLAFKKKINESITDAMQAKIHLEELAKQRETLRTKQESLRLEANIDELTGIYNRRYLEQQMREKPTEEAYKNLGIIMLDVDYFKEYNDFYGHLEGDKALKGISWCLAENQTDGVYPCRYGGDEFVCFCTGLTAEQVEAYIIAVRSSLERINRPHEKSPCADRVTLSIGYSVRMTADEDVNLILHRADQALYQSKLQGRNTFTRI